MKQFRRYLLVSDLASNEVQLDVVSWDNLRSVANPADYDGWILNASVLKARSAPKIFSIEELNVLFQRSAFGSVLLGGGRIYIVGDFTTAFFTPPSKGSGAGPISHVKQPTPPHSGFVPFEDILGVKRDARPFDYRRVSRPDEYNNKDIYEYLDKVTTWQYSLVVSSDHKAVDKIYKFGTTNFGTCAAATFKILDGWIVILPSLGGTPEDDEKDVLKRFFAFGSATSAPTWSKNVVMPGQREIEQRGADYLQRARELIEEARREEGELCRLERWKRLLYDDGVSLENIVGETFTRLGALKVETPKGRADYCMTVAEHGSFVLEVKGTRGDQFSRKDLRQLTEWMDDAVSSDLAEVKGALVGNAARDKIPTDRGEMFDDNNLRYAKLKQMVLLRSVDLYWIVVLDLVCRLDKQTFWREFFTTVGYFDAAKYADAVPTQFRLDASPMPVVGDTKQGSPSQRFG